MLSCVQLKNYFIFEDLILNFSPKFNVITGETGAGKSLFLKTLRYLLDEKPDKAKLQNPQQVGQLTYFFEGVAPQAYRLIYEQFPWVWQQWCQSSQQPGEQLSLKQQELIRVGQDFSLIWQAMEQDLKLEKQMSQKQLLMQIMIEPRLKPSYRINGQLVLMEQFQQLGKFLIDIPAQHTQQQLLKASTHVRFLDAYGQLGSILGEYQEKFHNYQKLKLDWEKLEQEQKKQQEQMAFLEDFFQQWEQIQASSQEIEQLLALRQEYKKWEQDYKKWEQVSQQIQKPDNAVQQLSELDHVLTYFSPMPEPLVEIAQKISNIKYECQDVCDQFLQAYQQYQEKVGDIDATEQRLSEISAFARKYNQVNILQLSEYAQNNQHEYESLLKKQENWKNMPEKLKKAEQDLKQSHDRLREAREKTAQQLEENVEKILHTLEMLGVQFRVFFKDREYQSNGAQQIEFQLSTNAGQKLKPLKDIASGGELSRVMLALKVLLNQASAVTLVFDEIDSGLSAQVAQSLAHYLSVLAKNKQVFCITHLALVACYGENHIYVKKYIQDGQTYIHLTTLGEKQKLLEVARLLSGEITSVSVAHAQQLLDSVSEA